MFGDDFTTAEAPDVDVQRAINAARGEFAIDDAETLGLLAAHNLLLYLTDPAAVDHGAGVVSETGTGELRSVIETGAVSPLEVDYLRTKYGRQYLRQRRALVALPW